MRFDAMIALSVLAVVPLGCSPSDGTTEARPLILGISPFQDTILPIIGERKGWYADEGLDIQIRILGWTEVQEALAAGAIDVAINNCSAVVSTQSRFPDVVYAYAINTFDDGFALMIRPDGPIRPLSDLLREHPDRDQAIAATAAQLRGRSVVTTSRTDMEQGVAAAARRGSLNFIDDITIIDLNPDEGLAAFLGGVGDAYIGGIPQRMRAGREGMIELLTGADLGPPPLNGFVTTGRFLDSREEDILKLLRVWFRTVQWIDANLDEAAVMVSQELGRVSGAQFAVDDFKMVWNNLEHFPANPREAEREILNPDGSNYWRRRWEDCNHYFVEVARSQRQATPSDGVFRMRELHEAYVAQYGSN